MYQPSAADQAALKAAGYTGFPTSGATAANTPFPFWRCIAQALQHSEPGEKCDGLMNRTRTLQHHYGVLGQATITGMPGGSPNQFTVGGAEDRSSSGFVQSTQLGYINPDRSITGIPYFADGGITGGDINGVPFDNRVNLHGQTHTGSAFATDTLTLDKKWHLTAAGRYNRTIVHNADRIAPTAGTGSLTGDYSFGRFNGAAGVTVDPLPTLNLYLGYSEGSRAPTSIELGCADPNSPCKLPNSLGGDPPLHQVVTKTWEGGIRGKQWKTLNWSAGVFRARNRNDILFVASEQTGFGYFKNFGDTERRGAELELNTVFRNKLTIGGGYTFLDATFQSPETVGGSGNSTNDAATSGGKGLDGNIGIDKGNKIPLMPRHMLKVFADYEVTRRLSFDLDVIAVSTSFALGNENNGHVPDGIIYLGPGTSAGYGTANLGAHLKIHKDVELVSQLNNVLNHRYSTGAQLGPTAFTGTGNFIARPFPSVGGEFPLQQSTFFAPGAPRAYSASLRFRF